MRKFITRSMAVVATAAAVTAVALSIPPIRRRLKHFRNNVEKRMRYERGRAEGVRYRIEGNRPDPNVADDVLADRVRSSLGPIEKRLDIPRVHVSVIDQIVHLHGVVGTVGERAEIEQSCERISGVRGIESYLHVGLGPGDTRPSEAAWHPEPSRQLRQLLNAARGAGAPATGTWLAVRAVLSTFADRIPETERQHVFAHLPTDVIGLASAPRRKGAAQPRTLAQLVETVQDISGLTIEDAANVTDAVIASLRTMIPDEIADVSATLPADLREFWNATVPV